jgi:hypothetical protein
VDALHVFIGFRGKINETRVNRPKQKRLSPYQLPSSIDDSLHTGGGRDLHTEDNLLWSGGMPSPDFSPSFSLLDSNGIGNLPDSIALAPGDKGQLCIDGLEAIGPDTAYVAAKLDGFSFSILSNPAWIFKDPPFRIYWGDIHIHTTFSNCSPWACKTPEFCYEYARDVTHLDFAAPADHVRGIIAEPHRWDHLKELVRRYDEPNRFVPFLGFESSHSSGFGGDNNVLFKDFYGDVFRPDRPDVLTAHPEIHLTDLWDFLDKTAKCYMTIPHHTGRGDKFRSFNDPVVRKNSIRQAAFL